MHFLLTNDDGIHAAGLAALERAVRSRTGSRCTIVAPAEEHSQCGHRITTHSPLKAERVGEDRYQVHGAPADCVRVALFGLGVKPDFVLAGINHGGNLGQDVFISGTVAAAREAAYHGVPALAFSHYLIRGLAVDWDRAGDWVGATLGELCRQIPEAPGLWNVNLPHLPPGALARPECVHSELERAPLGVSFRRVPSEDGTHEHYHYEAAYSERPRGDRSDVAICFGGRISVTRISLP